MNVKISAAIAGILMVVGCQSKDRPFADVAGQAKGQELHATAEQAEPAAPATAPAPAEAAAVAQPAPVVQPTVERPVSVAAIRDTAAAVYDNGEMRRPWPISVAARPSGDVAVLPTYYQQIDEKATRPDWQAAPLDLGQFMLNTLLLPVRMVQTPPWRESVYSPAAHWDWQPLDPQDHLYVDP